MANKKYRDVGEGVIKASKRRIVRRHRNVEDSRVYRRSTVVVSLLLGSVAFGVVAIFMIVSNIRREKPASGEVSPQLTRLRSDMRDFQSSDEEEARKEVTAEEAARRLQRVTATVASMVEAKTVEDFLPLVAKPEVHREAIEKYFSENMVLPIRVINSGQAEMQGRLRTLVRARVGLRTAMIVIDQETAKIDWESMVGYNSRSYEEILTETLKPEGVAIRCVVKADQKSQYYNYDYNDSDQWLSAVANHPDFERAFYLYLNRKSDVYAKFVKSLPEELDQKAAPELAMTIVIKAASQKALERNQFEVVEILSNTWYLPELSRIADWKPSQDATEEGANPQLNDDD